MLQNIFQKQGQTLVWYNRNNNLFNQMAKLIKLYILVKSYKFKRYMISAVTSL